MHEIGTRAHQASANIEQRQWSFHRMDNQLPRADLLLSRDIHEVRMPA